MRRASVFSDVVVVQCSMNWANIADLEMSVRCLVVDAPQFLQRHLVVPLLVVPLRFMSPPQWQRGRFLAIGKQHHGLLPHVWCHTVYFGLVVVIYALWAYIFCVWCGQVW